MSDRIIFTDAGIAIGSGDQSRVGTFHIYGTGVVLLALAVAISAWALYPSTVETGIYVPPPVASTPSAAHVDSAGEGVAGNPRELSGANASSLMDATVVSSTPTMYGSATVRYSSPVVAVSLVPLRSKLQALLMLLYSQSGDVDLAALEAKLQALLQLPDSVLALLMEHPDLADLNEMLDAVFLGTSDLSGVKTELDKIDVISVPGPSEKIDVVKVNGTPAFVVHSPTVQARTENAAGSSVSALPPPPSEQVTVTVLSQVQVPAALTASTFAVAPTSAQLAAPPAPASQIMSAFTVAPTSQQLAPTPAPASQIMSAFTVAPSSEQLTPSPPRAPPPMPSSTPKPKITNSREEPTGTPQTSLDDLNSGTTDGGSTTNKGGSTTDGGSTTNKGGSTTDGGSTTNKGGHTGDTNDGAKKGADNGEK